MLFSHGKDSSFNPQIIRKWTSTDKEIWVENSVFAIQHMENRKRFIEVLSSHDQTNPFAYSCIFTGHTLYKNSMMGHGGGGRCQNAQIQFIIKTY